MDWLGDYLRFCLSGGTVGGLILLAISGAAVLVGVLAVLVPIRRTLGFGGRLGRAFVEGWRASG